MAATLNSKGLEALRRANIILPAAGPISGLSGMGALTELQPGSYDREQRLLVIGQFYGQAWYIHKRALWSMPLGQFVHNYQIGQVAAAVVRETRWIIPAAKAMTAFGMALATGVGGWMVVGASLAVTGLRVTSFYVLHQREVDRFILLLGPIVRVLRWVGQHAPVTYRQLGSLLGSAMLEGIRNVPEGFQATDLAPVAGTMLGAIIKPGAEGLELTLGVGLQALRKGLLAGATKLPAMGARGTVLRARATADQFLRGLRDAGVALSRVDAEAIVREFERVPMLGRKLAELQAGLEEAAPILDALAAAFRMEALPEIEQEGVEGS